MMTDKERDEYRMKIIMAKMSQDTKEIQSASDEYIYALEAEVKELKGSK